MSVRWVYAFADRPAEAFGAACEFWTTVTDTRASAPRGDDGEFVTLLPAEGDAFLKAQAVGGAGGVHLDLAVDDVAAAAAAAHPLGASVVAAHDGWQALRSPGGLPFCLVPWHGEAHRPPVVTGPGGDLSRLDQVCLDVPPPAYDAELAFWSGMTGWPVVPGGRPEFTVVQSPPGQPLRLLVQRLADDGPIGAHLDIACADVTATRARHEVAGARFARLGHGWTVMRDPAGVLYCLTGRDPGSGD
ncbi:VOC family protein [Spirilliplanes yamanashiensis]|uniref:Glyoxalase-like domain-containing protein n=1 Tax=Spirilliplanes yamanashiensis TaxID=42233 RepID=A0A8J3Y7J0_9ACTN|nr:VOC family protein [Spirilliplanes yamanashiensis]MDP9817103.1 hypothetical protein [Spirilliplanes yamanashiensis]GIJ03243.1 hypothetical protein Sya03_25950 [Spirilliplanes yamanashiensis]